MMLGQAVWVGISGIGTVTIPLRTTFWVKLRWLNHFRPKWMIFRSWKQIGKYQQVTCFFPLFGHPTTVSLPHLVPNSCLPSSRRLRWWTISWTWRTTPFRSWGAWCPCLQAGPEFVFGSFRGSKIIWEKSSISYITYSVFHRNILDIWCFSKSKLKYQILYLWIISISYIYIYWIYISFISSNKSSRSNCELVALRGSNWSNKKRFRNLPHIRTPDRPDNIVVLYQFIWLWNGDKSGYFFFYPKNIWDGKMDSKKDQPFFLADRYIYLQSPWYGFVWT